MQEYEAVYTSENELKGMQRINKNLYILSFLLINFRRSD